MLQPQQRLPFMVETQPFDVKQEPVTAIAAIQEEVLTSLQQKQIRWSITVALEPLAGVLTATLLLRRPPRIMTAWVVRQVLHLLCPQPLH